MKGTIAMYKSIRWKDIRRGIKYPILVALIKFCIFCVSFCPRKWLLKGAGALGKLAFRLIKKERVKTIKNLTLIYGDTFSSEHIHNMAEEVFVNQALNFIDYVYTLHYVRLEQFSNIIEIKGEEHLRKAYDEKQGVICLMSHTGSWEFSAILPSLMGYETTALSRALPNPRIDKLIVKARTNRGMKNIGRGKAYPHLIEALAKKECLIIMIDQDTHTPGVFVDFFGKRAYTPVGAARLALDSKAPVIPMYMERLPNNKHRLNIMPRLPFVDTGDRENDLLENTKIYTKSIEDYVRLHPTQWVWMHERWKTTPHDVEVFLEKKRKSVQTKFQFEPTSAVV